MLNVCFYFQVHQPWRLRRYKALDIGERSDYFDEPANAGIMRKVAEKCYLPMNALLEELAHQHQGRFRFAFSISGTALDQFEAYAPDVLESYQRLVNTGCVELLAETHYHSLAFLFNRQEFAAQVAQHSRRIEALFGVTPRVFRNTELIYSDEVAATVAQLGYDGILTEGADRMLGWRSPNYVYNARSAPGFPVLLKNYRLSDDIAFRFGNQGWESYPLTADKFTDWANAIHGNGETLNLFMDYETFGEHQWASTGIFEFMRHLPGAILSRSDNAFATPSQVIQRCRPVGQVAAPDYVSWADEERDLSAWLGNPMQDAAADALYGLWPLVQQCDAQIQEDFKRLTTSDHVYYMCTKFFQDGDVHKYFSPYESPYEGYMAFMNVLNDLAQRVGFQHEAQRIPSERPGIRVA